MGREGEIEGGGGLGHCRYTCLRDLEEYVKDFTERQHLQCLPE